MKKSVFMLLGGLTATSVLAQSYTINPVIIDGAKESKNKSHVKDLMRESIFGDGGEALSHVNGVSVQRKGGHGNDPIIRGQKESRLNVKLGDRFVYGGCPSRMDPPSSYASLENFDQIEIHKGVHTLTEGHGGPAGTVIYKESDPILKDKNYEGKIGAGYDGNSSTKSTFTNIAFGNEKLKAKVKYALKDALDYKDGDDELIGSSFVNRTGGVNLYWNPSKDLETVLKYEVNNTEDATYSGLMMDSPKADLKAYDLKIKKQMKDSYINSIELTAYRSEVEHVMTNAKRNPTMLMDVDSTADTDGARVLAQKYTDKYLASFGVDYQKVAQNAQKNHNGSLNTHMWPDASLNQLGLFGEIENDAGYKFGLRVDQIKAKANKVSAVANMMAGSAEASYQSVYGVDYEDKTETNISALFRYNKTFSKKTQAFIGLSSTKRTADITERFIHKFASMGKMKETGNPDLKAETHNQIDLGYQSKGSPFSHSASVYYSKVSDFISIDRARGTDGILVSDGRAVYRNIDALLMGAEIELGMNFTKSLYANLAMNYTYGENTTDERALYEIPPVEYNLTFGMNKDLWDVSIQFKGAASQGRVDVDSAKGAGVDFGTSDAWMVTDLRTTYKLGKSWKFAAGVNNLFNQTYSKHLNMQDIINKTQVRVNEPGQSLWINSFYSF